MLFRSIYGFVLNAPIFAYTDAYPAPAPRCGPLQASHRQWPICPTRMQLVLPPMLVRIAKLIGESRRRRSGISVNQRHLAEKKYGWPLSRGNRLTRMSDYALWLIEPMG